MAIVKAVSSRASIANACRYVTKGEKTEDKLIDGINCNPQTALTEMQLTKELYDKMDGRQYKHFVLSYPPEEKDKISLEQVRDNARKLVEGSPALQGFQTLIAVHKDKDHLHAHIITNSVSIEDGHKLQWSNADLWRMKDHCNELSREQGLSIPEKTKDVTTWNIGKHKALEKAFAGEYKSYVLDIANAAADAKQIATSREDFIEQMQKKGITVEWSDRRTYVTFTDQDGHKVRNSKLGRDLKADFSKESFEHEFSRNASRQRTIERAEQQLRTADRTAEPKDRGVKLSAIRQERRNRSDRAGDVRVKQRERELAEARRRAEERARQADRAKQRPKRESQEHER